MPKITITVKCISHPEPHQAIDLIANLIVDSILKNPDLIDAHGVQTCHGEGEKVK